MNMPHPTLIQTAFNAGEISPECYGRVDLDKYDNACKTLKNIIPLLHGPAVRRSGSEYIAPVKLPNYRTRLIPFEFSVEQSYMLEFGHQYIRFYMDGAVIMHENFISFATNANPCVIKLFSLHHYSESSRVNNTPEKFPCCEEYPPLSRSLR